MIIIMSIEKQIKRKTQKEKFVEDAAVFASTEFVIVSFSAAS